MSDLTPEQKRKLTKIVGKFQGQMQKLADKGITTSIIVDGKTTVIAAPKKEERHG